MGNCTSTEEIKGQAPTVQKAQPPRPVKQPLEAVFEKKGGVKKAVEEPEEELIKTVPQIAEPAPEVVGDAAAVSEEPEVVTCKGIAALRSISPSRGLSLLYAAGENRDEPVVKETTAEAEEPTKVSEAEEEPVRTMREEPQASVDPVEDDAAPTESSSRELVVDEAEAQPEETPSRELQCESPSSPLSPADWVPDGSTKTCQCCGSNFTFARRRHHCRACGHVVCNGCSTARKVMPELGHTNPVRCCKACIELEH